MASAESVESVFGKDYIDSLPEEFAEYVEYDRTHEVDEEIRRQIRDKIDESYAIQKEYLDAYTLPENYKPRAGAKFLAILNAGDSDMLVHEFMSLIANSNILNLYYTGFEPRNDPEFVSTIWRFVELGIDDLALRQRIVLEMHKAVHPGPPARGGKKSKKINKRSRKKTLKKYLSKQEIKSRLDRLLTLCR